MSVQDRNPTTASRWILNMNGFGWQPCGQDEQNVAFATTSDEVPEAILHKIRAASGVTSLENQDFLGHNFLVVHVSDEQSIDKILNLLLRQSQAFTTHNRLVVKFDPTTESQYSRELAETKCIQEMRGNINKYGYSFRVQSYSKHAFTHPWNWQTAEGQAFSSELRRLLKCKHSQCQNPKHDYRQWDCFKKRETTESGASTSETSNAGESDESPMEASESQNDEITECMICLDRTPDTMVLPCEHCVVCKNCSDQLVDTNDARICVRCRRPITHVLD